MGTTTTGKSLKQTPTAAAAPLQPYRSSANHTTAATRKKMPMRSQLMAASRRSAGEAAIHHTELWPQPADEADRSEGGRRRHQPGRGQPAGRTARQPGGQPEGEAEEHRVFDAVVDVGQADGSRARPGCSGRG